MSVGIFSGLGKHVYRISNRAVAFHLPLSPLPDPWLHDATISKLPKQSVSYHARAGESGLSVARSASHWGGKRVGAQLSVFVPDTDTGMIDARYPRQLRVSLVNRSCGTNSEMTVVITAVSYAETSLQAPYAIACCNPFRAYSYYRTIRPEFRTY